MAKQTKSEQTAGRTRLPEVNASGQPQVTGRVARSSRMSMVLRTWRPSAKHSPTPKVRVRLSKSRSTHALCADEEEQRIYLLVCLIVRVLLADAPHRPPLAIPPPAEPSVDTTVGQPESVGTINLTSVRTPDCAPNDQLIHLFGAPPKHALHLYRLLHDLQPISSVLQHVRQYPAESDQLAIRHCKDLEGILRSWETSALIQFEQSRAALLDIRNLELLLQFAEEQQKTIESVMRRKTRGQRRWMLDHCTSKYQAYQSRDHEDRHDPLVHVPSDLASVTTIDGGPVSSVNSASTTTTTVTHDNEHPSSHRPLDASVCSSVCSLTADVADTGTPGEQVSVDFQLILGLNGQPVHCDLHGALQLVRLIKRRAEQHVHVRTVYVRSIKELIRINVSNLMRLYTWSLHTRPTTGAQHDKCFSLSKNLV